MPYLWGDWTYVLLIPAMLLAFWAQIRVSSTFNRYSKVGAGSGRTGAEVARELLDRAGLHDVRVERVAGDLTDHYDPRTRVLRLSQPVYDSTSVAALGVAAHEAGHALQHDEGYVFLGMRSIMYPVAAFGSSAAWPLFLIGFLFGGGGLAWLMDLGILLFMVAVMFYIVTLPVEFNASSRALAALEGGGYLTTNELRGARKVLGAAALTYVAAAAMAVLQLVRLLILRDRR